MIRHTAKVIGLLAFFSLVLGTPSLFAQKDFDKATYFPSAAAGEKKGKGEDIKGTLRFNTEMKVVEFAPEKGNGFNIKYDTIRSMTYERAAKPRYAAGLLIAWPLLFTKSKKHWLTVQYTDPGGQGQFALVQLHKSNFREALATAEAETGKKIERIEER